MTYDTAPYVAVDEYGVSADFVRCRATWTPRGGSPTTVEGDYLNTMGGVPVLRCGIYDISSGLDLPVGWITDEKCIAVSDLVDRQLAERPWAVIICPEGTAKLELVGLTDAPA